MKRYLVRIPPEVADVVRHLHPRMKTMIRNALEELEKDPYLGKPLRDQLKGLFSLRVSHYRVVYRIKSREVLIEVLDIAERRVVYQQVAALVRRID